MTARTPQTHRISLDDGRTMTYRQYAGRGLPLVLIHGVLDSSEGWRRFARATSRPVICFDVPGFGGSSRATSPTLDSYADDIIEGLTHLGINQFTLVGHSLGGGIVATMAEKIPARIRALVLIAPAGFGRNRAAEFVTIPFLREVLERATPFWMANPFTMTATYMAMVSNGHLPELALIGRTIKSAGHAVPGARDAAFALVHAGNDEDALFKRKVGYDGPVFALWGSADRLIPAAHSAGVQTAFPQAKVTIEKGMGHHPQVEEPELLADFIEKACRVRCTPKPMKKANQTSANKPSIKSLPISKKSASSPL